MARISDLPLAAPLAGHETIPVVQDGQTRRAGLGDHLRALVGPDVARAENAAAAADQAASAAFAAHAMYRTVAEGLEATQPRQAFAVATGDHRFAVLYHHLADGTAQEVGAFPSMLALALDFAARRPFAFGLATGLPGVTVPSDIAAIQISGHAEEGRGAAMLHAVDPATVLPVDGEGRWWHRDAGGRRWKVVGDLPTLEQLGGGTHRTALENGAIVNAAAANGIRRIVGHAPEYRMAGVAVTGDQLKLQFNRLLNDTTDGTPLLTLGDAGKMVRAVEIEVLRMRGQQAAGHNIVIRGDVCAHSLISVTENEIYNPGAHLLTVDDDSNGRMTNTEVRGRRWQQPENATVSAVFADRSTSALNSVIFDVPIIFCAANHPFYRLLCRASDAFFNDIEFGRIAAEYGIGGVLHMAGAMNVHTGGIHQFDIDHSNDGVLVNDAAWFGSYEEYLVDHPDYAARTIAKSPTNGCFLVGLDAYARNAGQLPRDANGAPTRVDVRMRSCRGYSIGRVGGSANRGVTIDLGTEQGSVSQATLTSYLNYSSARHTLPATGARAIAKANVSSAQELRAGSQGIASVTAVGTGVVDVTLSAPVASIVSAVPIVTNTEAASTNHRVVRARFTSATVVRVTITDLAGAPVHSAFALAVIE